MKINTLNRTLVLLKRLINTSSSTKAIIHTEPQKPPVKVAVLHQPFPRVRPETEGITEECIKSFVRELKSHRELEIQNLLILKNGKILYENCFGANDYRLWKNTYSQCKTITGLAIGCLWDEGKITLQSKVIDILGDVVPVSSRLKFKNLTIEDLLTMRSSTTFNEISSMAISDWIKGFFSSGTSGEMGKTFNYNSLNSYMLSVIVKKLTGDSLCSYLEKKLFGPMGIEEYFWETCPNGIEKGGWGLYIRPEDLAKIGQLILNKGMWNNHQLISEEWIDKATSSHTKTPDNFGKYDYGYHIWVHEDTKSFLMNGMLGQNIMGFKNSGILVVSNAAIAEFFQQSVYYDIAIKHFYHNNFSENMLPDSRKGKNKPDNFYKSLDNKIFTVEKAPTVGLVPLFLQSVQNNYTKGTTSVSFKIENDFMTMTYCEADQEFILPVGLNKPIISDIEFHGEPYRVAVSGNCSINEDGLPILKVSVSFIETPCTRILKIYNDGYSLKMKCLETPGAKLITNGIKTFSKSFLERPVIGASLSKIDYDYVEYKIYRLFEPVLKLTEKK